MRLMEPGSGHGEQPRHIQPTGQIDRCRATKTYFQQVIPGCFAGHRTVSARMLGNGREIRLAPFTGDTQS